MLAYSTTPPRHRPAFVYDVPCVASRAGSYDDDESSLFASSSKMSSAYPQRQQRPRGPSSASTLSYASSASSSSSSTAYSSYPTAPRTRTRRYSPVPEPSDEDEEESELEFDSHSHASPSDDEHEGGAGWHYTYASASSVSHRRRQHHDDSKPIPISFHASSSPTSPKRELSDANERRLSAELRRSPVPTHTALPPSSYSPPPRRSPIRAALLTRDDGADNQEQELSVEGRRLRAGMALSSNSLRRRTRREGWGEFDEKHTGSSSSPRSSPIGSSSPDAALLFLSEKPTSHSALHLHIEDASSSYTKEVVEDEDVEEAEVEEKDEEEEAEGNADRTPTCTDALAREWHTLVLRWRFRVFRAKRRVRGAFASRR